MTQSNLHLVIDLTLQRSASVIRKETTKAKTTSVNQEEMVATKEDGTTSEAWIIRTLISEVGRARIFITK